MTDKVDLEKLRKFLKSKKIDIIRDPYVYISKQDLGDGIENHPDHYIVTFDGEFLVLREEIDQ